MELLYTEGVHKGRITLNKYVEVACTNPAKIFGIFPRKGTIAVGSDADIVIFDPDEKHKLSVKTHHMNVDYSGYEGWELTGKVKTVVLRGKVAIENNQCKIDKGYGKFIRRNKVSQLI
jgi:dihydropyrimidinase